MGRSFQTESAVQADTGACHGYNHPGLQRESSAAGVEGARWETGTEKEMRLEASDEVTSWRCSESC